MTRYLRAAFILWVILRYGLDELALSGFRLTRGLARIVSFGRRLDAPRGQRLRQAFEHLGPIFVKFGQVLSTRRDLLPQDVAPATAANPGEVRRKLSTAIGLTWTNELITIAATDPAGAVAVQPSTVVEWRDGTSPAPVPTAPAEAMVQGASPPAKSTAVSPLAAATFAILESKTSPCA